MKKLSLIIIMLSVFGSLFYAQESEATNNQIFKKNYYFFDSPENLSNYHNHFVNTSFTVPFTSEYQDDYLSMNLGYRYENLYTKASAGFQTSKTNFKFFINDTLWLINQAKINNNGEEYYSIKFGLKSFFNINHYNDLVTYYNVLIGEETIFNLRPNTLSLSTEFLIDATIGNINTGDSESLIINWWDLVFRVTLNYYLPVESDFTLYLDMSNFDDYTIQRFYAPIISLGMKYDSPYDFSTSAEFNLHYTDLFSFSRYLQYASFTLKGEYKF